jgi:hypothetical protein
VANKVEGAADEQFIRQGLGDVELLGCVPYSPSLRADRDGRSVLDVADEGVAAAFAGILGRLEQEAAA